MQLPAWTTVSGNDTGSRLQNETANSLNAFFPAIQIGVESVGPAKNWRKISYT